MTTAHERAQVLSDAFQELGFHTEVRLTMVGHCNLYLQSPRPPHARGLILLDDDGAVSIFDQHSLWNMPKEEIWSHLKTMGIAMIGVANLRPPPQTSTLNQLSRLLPNQIPWS